MFVRSSQLLDMGQALDFEQRDFELTSSGYTVRTCCSEVVATQVIVMMGVQLLLADA